jgi:hypothetical protein
MKNLLLLSTLILLAHTTIAQPVIEWQRAYGSNADDLIHDIKRTADGGFIFTGAAFAANGDVTGPVTGSYDIWVVKTDSLGVIEWDSAFGGTSWDMGYAVLQTPSGEYMVAGAPRSANGDIVGHHQPGTEDVWVARLAANGAPVWSRCYGGTGSDGPFSMEPTPDGHYIISGGSSSSDGDISAPKGLADFWALKIDATNGNILWERCYGGTQIDGGADITPTSDGGFILCGSTVSTDGDIGAYHGGSDMWIVKTDPAGNISWKKNIGGTKADHGREIIQTLDGGYAAIGYTASKDGDVINHKDSLDVLVVKLSPTGSVQWAKALGGVRDDFGTDIKQLTDGSFVITGYSYSSDGDISSANHGGTDIWFATLNASGDTTSQLMMGGTGNEFAQRICIISDSVFALIGYTRSDDGDVAGGGYHPGAGTTTPYDGWLVKLKIATPVSVRPLTASTGAVKAYPTFTSNVVKIEFAATHSNKSVTLLNATGQLVRTSKTSDNAVTLDLSGLSAGIYFLHAQADGQTYSFKIVYQP